MKCLRNSLQSFPSEFPYYMKKRRTETKKRIERVNGVQSPPYIIYEWFIRMYVFKIELIFINTRKLYRSQKRWIHPG